MLKPDNQILVIFGASGDLTGRKLLPSLFELFQRGLLPENFLILGTARSEFSEDEFREHHRQNLLKYRMEKTGEKRTLDNFLPVLRYLSFNSDEPEEYGKLKKKITELRRETGIPDNIIFYLATPPLMYELIPDGLKTVRLNRAEEKGGWRRIIVEKPFGTDLKSAKHLNTYLRTIFKEEEIYRIDHYLGKETVQNILVLRFSNGIFEPLWNRNYIDYVEITASEVLGVENRGSYYEGAGALRDMVQNHLMHLMAFVAMESPAAFDAESLRDEISKVFRSLHPLSAEDIVRGQYTAGVADGSPIPAYRAEKGVASGSLTETYVSMRFFIDNWRWGGVPFYFHTGKRLPEKKSEIIVHFKSTPHQFFVGGCSGSSCNKLTLRIQPDESISLRFGLKMPGAGFEVKQVSMDFRYDSLSSTYLADAYERLLLDAMQGDSTLYTRGDALETSWQFFEPILQEWKQDPGNRLYFYEAGTGGPKERALLMFREQTDVLLVDGKLECPL